MSLQRAWMLPVLLASLFFIVEVRAQEMTEPAKKVAAELKAEIEKDAQLKAYPVETDALAAPCSLTFVRAFAKGAYPGTGVFGVLMDADGVTYGKRGRKDFADLVRARGWLEKAPEAATLVQLANMALWDNLLAVDESEPPVISKKDGGLTLRFMRRTFPSGAHETVVVRVEKTGAAKSEIKSDD